MTFKTELLKLLLVVFRFLRVGFVYISSRSLSAITAIIDTIKKIGITTVIAYIFILGFVFKAILNFINDGEISILFLSISRIFVASEHEIITYIDFILSGNLSVLDTILNYLNIIGAIVVFVYMISLLNILQKKLSSNSSYSGLSPTVISIIILMLLEFSFLSITSLSEYNGDITKLTTVNIMPFRGIYYLVINFNDLFGGVSSFLSPNMANETINDIIITDNTTAPRGVISTIICSLTAFC